MNLKYLFLALCCIAATTGANAQTQTKNRAFLDYIEKYKDIAIEQMDRHGIPASITLAQGLLESGAGSSSLAQRSNNHFGIKCGGTWLGPTTTHFDDGRNECFRVYESVRDSYEDHSQFLHKERYMRLFRLNVTDYKGWARGLKSCGYATSPTYAERLINIIELYELNRFDRDKNARYILPERTPVPEVVLNIHPIHKNNGILCIVANAKDTWESLAKEMAVSKNKLLKYNEAYDGMPITPGEYIYLGKKQSKAAKEYGGNYWHHVQKGESMYSISQKYGISLKKLYKMNFKNVDYTPVYGDLLKVR